MSIWSSATGIVTIESSEHFSLKKYTYCLYDEVLIDIEHGIGSPKIDKFCLRVCLEGMNAVEFFNKWVEGIPGKVDMTFEVRVLK